MKAEDSALSSTLSGRWLGLARAVWWLVLVAGLGLNLLNIPWQFQQYQEVCAASSCSNLQFTAQQAQELARLGLSMPLVAGYLVGLSLLQGLGFVAVGVVIFWRKRDDPAALFMSFTMVAFGISSSLGLAPRAPRAVQFLILLFSAVGNSSIVLFFFLFPDGHFQPRSTRWLAPFAVAREWLAVFLPSSIFNTLFLAIAPLIVLLQVYRYRRFSTAIQRQQTKWVVFGSLLGLGSYVGLLIFFSLYTERAGPMPALPTLAIASAVDLSLLFIPLSIAFAILRSHLWDIDLLIRRTLVYALLTAFLALVYLGSVVALQGVFTVLTGQQRSELVTVISTLAIAALFVPLRGRLQAAIDRRFYRRKYDAARTLAEFGATLREEVNLDELSERLAQVVDETMQPESVGLLILPATAPPTPLQAEGGRGRF